MSKIVVQTYGSDPEVFIKNQKTKQYVSAEGIIPGTKDIPHKLDNNGLAIQPDNVMLEFSLPIAKDVEMFKVDFKNAIKEGNKFLANVNKDYVIDIISSATFTDEALNTEHAQTIGCSTDYNVWTKDENPKVNIKSSNERWAGGHIHIGLEDPSLENVEAMVKAFDMFLTLPFVFMDPNDERKHVYGTAGRFRFTPYGFENRTLSNYWLSSDELIDYVFNQITAAVEYINNGYEVPEEVIDIINSVDKDRAVEFCNKYSIKYETVSNKTNKARNVKEAV